MYFLVYFAIFLEVSDFTTFSFLSFSSTSLFPLLPSLFSSAWNAGVRAGTAAAIVETRGNNDYGSHVLKTANERTLIM